MIKKEFEYLGKNVKLEAYNNGGLQVVSQFLKDYISKPFEDMVDGKELSFFKYYISFPFYLCYIIILCIKEKNI